MRLSTKKYNMAMYIEFLTFENDNNEVKEIYSVIFNDIEHTSNYKECLFEDDFQIELEQESFFCDLETTVNLLEKLFLSGKFLFYYMLLENIKEQDPLFYQSFEKNYEIPVVIEAEEIDWLFDDDFIEPEYIIHISLKLYNTIELFFNTKMSFFDFLKHIVNENFAISFLNTSLNKYREAITIYLSKIKNLQKNSSLLIMLIMHLALETFMIDILTVGISDAKRKMNLFWSLFIVSFKYNPYEFIEMTFIKNKGLLYKSLIWFYETLIISKTNEHIIPITLEYITNNEPYRNPLDFHNAFIFANNNINNIKSIFALDFISVLANKDQDLGILYTKHINYFEELIKRNVSVQISLVLISRLIELNYVLDKFSRSKFEHIMSETIKMHKDDSKHELVKLLFINQFLMEITKVNSKYIDSYFKFNSLCNILFIDNQMNDNTTEYSSLFMQLSYSKIKNIYQYELSDNAYNVFKHVDDFINSILDSSLSVAILRILQLDINDLHNIFNDGIFNQCLSGDIISIKHNQEINDYLKIHLYRLSTLSQFYTLKIDIESDDGINEIEHNMTYPIGMERDGIRCYYIYYKLMHQDVVEYENKITSMITAKLDELNLIKEKLIGTKEYDYNREVEEFIKVINDQSDNFFTTNYAANALNRTIEFFGNDILEILKLFSFSYYLSKKYVFVSYEEQIDIDYTTILTGYIKGVEQLMALIVQFSVSKLLTTNKITNVAHSKEMEIDDANWKYNVSAMIMVNYLRNEVIPIHEKINNDNKFKLIFLQKMQNWVTNIRNSKFHQSNVFYVEGQNGVKKDIYETYSIIWNLFVFAYEIFGISEQK